MPDNSAAFALLKAALGRRTVPDEIALLMFARIDQARGALLRAGIEIDDTDPADLSLLAAYAEWLYMRRNSEDPKPRSLVDEIHSRQVAKSTGGSE